MMMDQKQVKQLKTLIKLMHEQGITHLKVDGIELTCPSPKPSIKQQIMSISPKEFNVAAQSAYGNHKNAMESIGKPKVTMQSEMDELDEILFYHEKA